MTIALRQGPSPATATQGPFEDVEVIPTPDLRILDDFVLYWNRKRAGRLAPRAAEMEPAELAGHGPSTVIVDVLDGGADFRYRFIGKRLVDTVGRDATGRRFSDLYWSQPDALAQLRAVFSVPVEQKHLNYIRGRIFWLPNRDYRKFTAALVPLSEDGFTVSAVFAEVFIFPAE